MEILWVLNSDNAGLVECLADFVPHVTFRQITHGQPAIDYLVTRPSPLVLIEPWIAPGDNYSDPGFALLMKQKEQLGNPDYYAIGLRVIERVRESTSLNKNAIILVTGLYSPQGSTIVPGAKRRAIKAGANEYFDLSSRHGFKDLASRVRHYFG